MAFVGRAAKEWIRQQLEEHPHRPAESLWEEAKRLGLTKVHAGVFRVKVEEIRAAVMKQLGNPEAPQGAAAPVGEGDGPTEEEQWSGTEGDPPPSSNGTESVDEGRGAPEMPGPPISDATPIEKQVGCCAMCGCTEDDCSECIEETGEPCSWAFDTPLGLICSNCAGKFVRMTDGPLDLEMPKQPTSLSLACAEGSFEALIYDDRVELRCTVDPGWGNEMVNDLLSTLR